MTFNEYQNEIKSSYTEDERNKLLILTLGLIGSAGAAAEKIKNILGDKNRQFDISENAPIGTELGNILWHLSQLSNELGYSLNDIATSNIHNLKTS